MPAFEIVSNQGIEEMDINVKDMLSGFFGQQKKKRKMTVAEAFDYLIQEEENKLIDMDHVTRLATERAEQMGIIFIDEIDKIAGRETGHGPDVSREGVQRDILPIVEGTTVNTRYGMVRTDHILFIAAGAFHISKPSDLIPELQGRLPLRVELSALTEADFVRILTEPKNALIKQYIALLETEGVKLSFSDDAIAALARFAVMVNEQNENIGARRLHTILERVLDEISFEAPELKKKNVKIDAPTSPSSSLKSPRTRTSAGTFSSAANRRCPLNDRPACVNGRGARLCRSLNPSVLNGTTHGTCRVGTRLLSLVARLRGAGEPTARHPLIPQAVTDLDAKQQGDSVVLTFTLPRNSIDEKALPETPAIEIYREAIHLRAQGADWLRPVRGLPGALVDIVPASLVSRYERDGHIEFPDSIDPAELAGQSGPADLSTHYARVPRARAIPPIPTPSFARLSRPGACRNSHTASPSRLSYDLDTAEANDEGAPLEGALTYRVYRADVSA